MTSRHFYKHKLTGIVAALNDEFAGMFGDQFSLVGDTDTPDNSTPEGTPIPGTPQPEDKPADTTDSKKETK